MANKKTTKKEIIKNITKTEIIENALKEPLQKKDIKQREGGRGMMLDYLEGWWVKQNANRIFGINNWRNYIIFSSPRHSYHFK